jgi:hypothetical protein
MQSFEAKLETPSSAISMVYLHPCSLGSLRAGFESDSSLNAPRCLAQCLAHQSDTVNSFGINEKESS